MNYLSEAVMRLARAGPLDCTHFVAAALISGLTDQVPAVGEVTRSRSWRLLDRVLWTAVNIEDHSRPWSGLDEVTERLRLGGHPIEVASGVASAYHPLPGLAPDRWYYCQRWTPDRTSGHAYLLHGDGGGGAVVHDTNALRGYRATRAPIWCPPGYEWRFVRLP